MTPSQSALFLDPATGRKERSPWVIPIVLWIVALCIPLVLFLFIVAASVVAFALGAGNSFNLFGKGLERSLNESLEADQSGGTAANEAAAAAGPDFGSLNLFVLAAKLPQYQWVDGETNVPYSSAKNYVVGVNAGGTHIVTAIKADPFFCMYGLSVTFATDPLITEDHLPGPGTYFQGVWQAPQCVANQAPASGWQTWPLSLLGG